MQPDQSRRQYPAFRAWLIRLVVYGVAAAGAVLIAATQLPRLLPEGTPWPLATAA